jgi:hypothetical protein
MPEVAAPAEIVQGTFPREYSTSLPSVNFDWPHGLRAAVLAGLLSVILLVILQQAFALAMLISGFLTVYFYRRKNPSFKLTARTGALLGALSGIFGSVFLGIACTFVIFAVRSGSEAGTAAMAAFQKQLASNPDPQAQKFLEYVKTPDGFTVVMIGVIIVMFIFFLILSSLGGAITAALFRRKQRL